MSQPMIDQTVFVTLARSRRGRAAARFLIESLRAFGGPLAQCPVWFYALEPQEGPPEDLDGPGVRIRRLTVPEHLARYPFGAKVYACAQAERTAAGRMESMIVCDPACLITRPPLLFALDASVGAAVRPVHIRNVGVRASEPLDDYWQKVCATVGIEEISMQVETFVDRERIRAYFNSHAFAMDPTSGLCQRWLAHYETLLADEAFQGGPCQDDRHKLFLFQVLWSALLVGELGPKRIRILPPEYNYPYNLHDQVPAERRAAALNDLVTVVYEGRTLDPRVVEDVAIHEPLRAWLLARDVPDLR